MQFAKHADGPPRAEGTLGRTLTAPWCETWSLKLQVVSLQIADGSLALICRILNSNAKSCFLLLFQALTSVCRLCSSVVPFSCISPPIPASSAPFIAVPSQLSSSGKGETLSSGSFPPYPSPPKYPLNSFPQQHSSRETVAAAQTFCSQELQRCLCPHTERDSKQIGCALLLAFPCAFFPSSVAVAF